jgi:hypothetical protein
MRFALIVAIACLSGAPARAGDVTYTDYASWSAAMSGTPTNVTIPDPSPSFRIWFGSGSQSVTYAGVTFSTSSGLGNGNFFNVGPLDSGDPAVLSSQLVIPQETTGVPNILTTLPGDVTGFALYYGTFGGSNVTFLLSNGDSVTLGSTGSGYSVPDFFGVTDATPFDSVLMTSSDMVLNLNNVSYAAAGSTGSTIPEPATWLLVTGALLGAALLWRRRVN